VVGVSLLVRHQIVEARTSASQNNPHQGWGVVKIEKPAGNATLACPGSVGGGIGGGGPLTEDVPLPPRNQKAAARKWGRLERKTRFYRRIIKSKREVLGDTRKHHRPSVRSRSRVMEKEEVRRKTSPRTPQGTLARLPIFLVQKVC